MKINNNKTYTLIKETIEVIAKVNDISVAKRSRKHIELRWIYYALSRHFLGGKFTALHCSKLINRDHSTVLHALRQYDNMLETNQFESLEILNKCKDELTPFLGGINDDEVFLLEAKIKYFYNSLILEQKKLNDYITNRAKKYNVNYKAV